MIGNVVQYQDAYSLNTNRHVITHRKMNRTVATRAAVCNYILRDMDLPSSGFGSRKSRKRLERCKLPTVNMPQKSNLRSLSSRLIVYGESIQAHRWVKSDSGSGSWGGSCQGSHAARAWRPGLILEFTSSTSVTALLHSPPTLLS